MRKDERRRYIVGDSVKEAIYKLGGCAKVSEQAPKQLKIPASTLYKWVNNTQKILYRRAFTLASVLKSKPIFHNGVFDVVGVDSVFMVEKKDTQPPQLVSLNYCFNCGSKLKENE
jgi:hypothetical protein